MVSDESELSDADLVRRIVEGERDLFREVVRRYQRVVFSSISRQVQDAAAVEELAQETFLKAFLALKNFRFESTLSTWLVRIGLNLTSSYFVSRRYRDQQRFIADSEKLERVAHNQAATDVDERMNSQTLQRALTQLDAKFHEIIVLCALEERSYEEAATVLGIPIGTVRSRLNKARILLREILRKEAES